MSLKNKVEAVLFAVGKKIAPADIARLCQASEHEVEQALIELKRDYESRDTGLLIFSGERLWKIDVKQAYLDLVQHLVVHTDLSRPTMETLSLIAYKKGALQSEIIKQRGVAAYEHIHELLDMGFISRKKEGRSYRLVLAVRFFEYFDVGEDQVASVFSEFLKDEDELADSEQQVLAFKKEQAKDEEEIKKSLAQKEERSQKQFSQRMDEIDAEVAELP